MADIIRSEKPLAVSPIKTGQPLGAILASLGLQRLRQSFLYSAFP